MARKGKKVCWKYGKGRYCGTLIPSMEDEKNRYARTENGKIKTLENIYVLDKKAALHSCCVR